jgi:hypothetical protein
MIRDGTDLCSKGFNCIILMASHCNVHLVLGQEVDDSSTAYNYGFRSENKTKLMLESAVLKVA